MKKTVNKIVKVDEIKLDKRLYPRDNTDYYTVSRYAEALKTGADFPPITVAEFEGKKIIIDGMHRLKAHAEAKKPCIQAKVLIGYSLKELYKESVIANIGHGRPFSHEEVKKIAATLKDMSYTLNEITQIVHVPLDKISRFTTTSLRRVGENKLLERFMKSSQNRPEQKSTTGRPTRFHEKVDEIISKSEFKPEKIEMDYTDIDNFVDILKTKKLDIKDKYIKTKLGQIQKLIKKILSK